MTDQDKTKAELIQEIEQLKSTIAHLKAGEMVLQQAGATERRYTHALEMLHQASLSLTASLDLATILRFIAEYALQLVDAVTTHIFLYDGEELTFGAALWANQQQEKPFANPRKEGFTYHVARLGQPVLVSDMSDHPLYEGTNWAGSILGLPLRIGQLVRGVMTVSVPEPNGFAQEDVGILELLADQAAIAVQNAQHVSQIEKEINERRLAEKALRESETRYRSLFENSPISLREEDWSEVRVQIEKIQQSGSSDIRQYFEQNPQELQAIAMCIRVLDINETTLTLYEAQHKDELCNPLTGLFFSWKACKFFKDGVLALLEDKTYYEAEVEHQTVTGHPLQLLMSLALAPGHRHNWAKILISAVDITQLKEAEEQALILEKERTRTNTLYKLIQAITHDLRTPLTAISTSTYLLRQSTDEERRAHHLNIIEGQTTHLSKLIDSILALARLDTQQSLQLVDVDLHQLFYELEVRFETLIKEKNLKFTIVNEFDELDIKANASELHIALGEVLKNAIQFTPEAGEILMETYLQDDFVIISIQDNGIGMSEEVMAQAFDRFYRADAARSTKTGGTGLGLALAKKIIELHHGYIEVVSEVGVGTIFRIFLPHQPLAQ